MSQAADHSLTAPSESQPLRTSQEPIESLPYFSSLILHAAKSSPNPDHISATFAAAFHADCVACGIRTPGDQLLKLGSNQPTSDDKLARLQKGYCARRTCDSRFYQLTCHSTPGIDWTPILNIKDGYTSAPDLLAVDELDPTPTKLRPRHILLASLAVMLPILLGIAWQFYAGGSIPFLRPAEKFEVDSAGVLEELSRIK